MALAKLPVGEVGKYNDALVGALVVFEITETWCALGNETHDAARLHLGGTDFLELVGGIEMETPAVVRLPVTKMFVTHQSHTQAFPLFGGEDTVKTSCCRYSISPYSKKQRYDKCS